MIPGYAFESTDIAIFFTLLFLEGVLSFDNAAIIAAMVRKLPVEQRRKAVFYGLAGAYAFRVIAILSVAFIIANPWLKLVGGAYLVYLAVKHLVPRERAHKEHVEKDFLARFGITGFWGVVLSVELADLAFALDQVLVAVAMTEKIPLIIAASLIAILFLRLAASYMTRLMDWFPALEKLAYVAVGFVGTKLLVVEIAHMTGNEHFEIPKAVSVAVTLMLLVVPVIGKFVYERVRGRASTSG